MNTAAWCEHPSGRARLLLWNDEAESQRGLPHRRSADARHQCHELPPRCMALAARRPAAPAPAACLSKATNEDDAVKLLTMSSLTADLGRKCSIQWLTQTKGWTVFEIPSTPGRCFRRRPPRGGREDAAPAACRGSPERRRDLGVDGPHPFLLWAHSVQRYNCRISDGRLASRRDSIQREASRPAISSSPPAMRMYRASCCDQPWRAPA